MKKTFKFLTCLIVAILCFGQMWATDYTLSASTFNGDKNSSTVNGQTFTFDNAHGGTGQTGYSDYIKFSKKKTYTITLPTGFALTNINIKGYTNADGATNGEISSIGGNAQSGKTFPARNDADLATATQITTGYNFAISQTGGTVAITTANTNQICVLITISGTPAGGGEDPGEDPGDEPDPDAPTTGTIDDLVTIDDAFTYEPTAALTDGYLYEGKKIFSKGGSGYNNGVQIKSNRQLAFKVAAGAKIVVTFNQKEGRNMQIGTSSAGTDLANSASSPVTAIRTTAGIVYISASSDLYLTKLEISYPTFYTITYNYNGGTLKDGESDITESAKESGATFTVASAAVLDAPEGKEFDKWNDGSADYAPFDTYTVGTANVTLTAQWRNETTKYAVTYDLGDYTAGVAPTETDKSAGSIFAIQAAPEWTDHDFLGWKCNIDNETYQAADYYTMTAAATTFTAQWQAFFTITYKDGDETLGTEKVNAGSAPVGISDPAKELYSFAGWTLEGGSDLVNPASLTENTVLVAKWVDFDGCAYLAVDLTAEATLSVGDNVALKNASFGGSVMVAGMKQDGSIVYNGYGLYLNAGGADSLRVTIDHQMQVGSKITVALYTSATGTRGLNLLNKNCGAVDGGTMLGWESATAGASKAFSYIVKADDGLDGEKMFHLQRNGSVFLKYITVENCAAQDFTVTYKDGASTMGTESVIENEHPTAAGISTHKNGYIFEGWAETADGAVVELSNITITGEKTLYAKYTARDCSGAGTKFKFQMKTDLTNGNMFATAPVPATAMTTENFLSALVGGEVEVSNTNSNNNRIVINDQKAIGFANGAGGKLTLKLDCPLAENDEVRFINYAKSGNSITLSDGTNSTTLDGNNSETVQKWSVPAAWAGAYELTMVRNAGTAKLTSFEIYRCPALTSVTLEDLKLKVGNTGTPVMTLNPEGALVTSQAWAITASTATGTTIDENTGLITAGETAGQLTVKVTLNSDKVATCTVTVVPGFEAPKPVTETTTWNWATLAVAEDDGPTIVNQDTVLANYLSGEEWESLSGNVGGRPYRSKTYKAYQGTKLIFKATVPGVLKIYAGSTGSDKKVYVNGYEVGTVTSDKAYLDKIVVPAGDVVITSESMRIYSMTFDTDLSAYTWTDNVLGGYDRAVTVGNYGTICLPNGGIIVGATLFEISYYNEGESKIFFDEVENNNMMVAGRPYIFWPSASQIEVFYTDKANASAGSYNGLHGSYTQELLSTAGSDYILYQNQYYLVNSPAYVGAYRAYIKLGSGEDCAPTNDPGAAPGRRRISMAVQGTQVATGISDIEAGEQPMKVMMDGKLYIIRAGQMYDMTGSIVK